MPPPFDDMQIHNALRTQAIPALEAFAENPRLRDRGLFRFDRDEPPPYASSTEDEEDDMPHPALGPVDSATTDEFNRLLDAPLNDDGLDQAAQLLEGSFHAYDPGKRYNSEAALERKRIERWARSKARQETTDYFVQLGPARKARAGIERINIIARHNVKRRWQKLGVWNPTWGIPGRKNNLQPNDDAFEWKWRWQYGSASGTWHGSMELNQQHPITRAVRLREGLRRSQYITAPPRSHLQDDALASEAESFVISRPWFSYKVNRAEEAERYIRIPQKQKRLYRSAAGYILASWKNNGDWKAEWTDRYGDTLIGWKWQHESPSPEPEDLAGLDDMGTFDLTPSEVDALEAIPPPSPPTPRRTYIPPDKPGTGIFDRVPYIPPATSLGEAGRPIEDAEQASPPPQPERRPGRQQQYTTPAQPPRRSARIAAAMTTTQPLPVLPQQQQQRLRATRPTPARPPDANRTKQVHRRKASDSVRVSKPRGKTKRNLSS